jgi:hypothetical protein
MIQLACGVCVGERKTLGVFEETPIHDIRLLHVMGLRNNVIIDLYHLFVDMSSIFSF